VLAHLSSAAVRLLSSSTSAAGLTPLLHVQVVSHVEAWNVSGTQALLQMFRPAGDRLKAEQES
jgi:hypothetical protein